MSLGSIGSPDSVHAAAISSTGTRWIDALGVRDPRMVWTLSHAHANGSTAEELLEIAGIPLKPGTPALMVTEDDVLTVTSTLARGERAVRGCTDHDSPAQEASYSSDVIDGTFNEDDVVNVSLARAYEELSIRNDVRLSHKPQNTGGAPPKKNEKAVNVNDALITRVLPSMPQWCRDSDDDVLNILVTDISTTDEDADPGISSPISVSTVESFPMSRESSVSSCGQNLSLDSPRPIVKPSLEDRLTLAFGNDKLVGARIATKPAIGEWDDLADICNAGRAARAVRRPSAVARHRTVQGLNIHKALPALPLASPATSGGSNSGAAGVTDGDITTSASTLAGRARVRAISSTSLPTFAQDNMVRRRCSVDPHIPSIRSMASVHFHPEYLPTIPHSPLDAAFIFTSPT